MAPRKCPECGVWLIPEHKRKEPHVCKEYNLEKATECPAPSGQAEFYLLSAKARAKQYVDANVWDGEDRAGCPGDSARFTPDELQELVDEVRETHRGELENE